MQIETINIGEILGIILGAGGVVFFVIKWALERKSKREERENKKEDEKDSKIAELEAENVELKLENTRLKEVVKGQDMGIKRLIRMVKQIIPKSAPIFDSWEEKQ